MDHQTILGEMQRLRGAVYLKDGAIQSSRLTRDGRHEQEADRHAWHVLLVEADNTVSGCARYVSHPANVTFDRLGVSRCPLAQSKQWRLHFRYGVEREIRSAIEDRIAIAEVGGWALAEELRHTREALRIALASYALAHALGECLGIGTATWRHASSSILRRIGGRPLQVAGIELPAYFDSSYACQMEVLRFDSRRPNPRYQTLTGELKKLMRAVLPRQGSAITAIPHAAVAVSAFAF